MTTIVFANPKGGAGKTTAALLLATELAEKGTKVVVIDADPERWITGWSKLPGMPASLAVVSEVTEETIVDVIEKAETEAQFVVVDLEGTASLMVSAAVSMADLVVIPTRASSLDAKGAIKTLKSVRQVEKIARRHIPYAVLLTQTSAAVATRSQKFIAGQFQAGGIETFKVEIVERAAYRDLFSFGGTLARLDPASTANIDRAIENARAFAGEVIAKLRAATARGAA